MYGGLWFNPLVKVRLDQVPLRTLFSLVLKMSKDGNYTTSGQHAPLLNFRHNKAFFPYTQSELPILKFMTVISRSPATYISKSLSSAFFVTYLSTGKLLVVPPGVSAPLN